MIDGDVVIVLKKADNVDRLATSGIKVYCKDGSDLRQVGLISKLDLHANSEDLFAFARAKVADVPHTEQAEEYKGVLKKAGFEIDACTCITGPGGSLGIDSDCPVHGSKEWPEIKGGNGDSV